MNARSDDDGGLLRVEYECLDGTPFPVSFADPGDVEWRWVLDREHAPAAMSPLADAVQRVGRPGAERAYAESGLRMPATLAHEPPRANGYEYYAADWLPEPDRDEFADGLTALAERHGGTNGVWSNFSLPRVQEACAWLAAAPPDTPFGALAERRAYVWSHTGVAGVVARRDLRAMASVCEPVVGGQATAVAYLLAQGWDNETIAADEALARLAAIDPDAAESGIALGEFLAAYGAQSTSWPIDHPTLAERPDLVLAQVRLLRRDPHRDIGAVRREAAERRRALAVDIRGRLGADERGRFDRRLARLEAFVPVREARARWQLVASGELRRAVQARGRRLVAGGVLYAVDDVFFLLPDEYDEPAADVREHVARRRAERDRWAALTPPVVIGNTEAGIAGETEGMLRGAAGAPGVAHGTARVVLDLAEVERLGPGDVLVTTMTSPPWTPLFSVAAAVVTDSGDDLSHVAIAAREYGIPCVVGTNYATVLVRDGATVVVDGDAGTLTFAARQPPARSGVVAGGTATGS